MITGSLAHHPHSYIALDELHYSRFDTCNSGGVVPYAADVVAQGDILIILS